MSVLRDTPVHEPTTDCDGLPAPAPPCPECGVRRCPCELAYGHDCEEST